MIGNSGTVPSRDCPLTQLPNQHDGVSRSLILRPAYRGDASFDRDTPLRFSIDAEVAIEGNNMVYQNLIIRNTGIKD